MVDVFKEKEALANELSDQYAKSLISLDEFESMIVEVSKVESLKQLDAVKKTVRENTGITLDEGFKNENLKKNTAFAPGKVKKREYETVFSSRSIVAESINGHAGNFTCVFGSNKIKIGDLPAGKTVLKLETVFGHTKIIVPKNVKIVNNVSAVFASVTTPPDEYTPSGGPELHIKGEAVFGNIVIKRAE